MAGGQIKRTAICFSQNRFQFPDPPSRKQIILPSKWFRFSLLRALGLPKREFSCSWIGSKWIVMLLQGVGRGSLLSRNWMSWDYFVCVWFALCARNWLRIEFCALPDGWELPSMRPAVLPEKDIYTVQQRIRYKTSRTWNIFDKLSNLFVLEFIFKFSLTWSILLIEKVE